MDEQISFSRRYRSFLLSGGARIFTTRLFSLIYIYVFTRLVAPDIYDKIVYLATTQAMLIFASHHGLPFSSVHFGLGKKKVEGGGILPFHMALTVGVPTIVILTELVVLVPGIFFPETAYSFVYFNPQLHLAYLGANIFAITSEGLIYSQAAILRSDREETLRSVYSISNSIFVPLAYFYFPSLETVVVTWAILLFFVNVLGIIMYPYKKEIMMFNFSFIRDVVAFGFIVNLGGIYHSFSQRYDQYVILLSFEPGTLANFALAQRLATIALEGFGTILTGIFPLLVKLELDRGKDAVRKYFTSFFKIGAYGSSLLFLGVYVFSDVIVHLIFDSRYWDSLEYLRWFAWSMWLYSLFYMVSIKVNSYGSRRIAVGLALFTATVRIVYITIGSQISLIAIVMAPGVVGMCGVIALFRYPEATDLTISTQTKALLIGAVHMIVATLIVIAFPGLYYRLVMVVIAMFLSLAVAWKLGYVDEEEVAIIKAVFKRKI